MPDSTARRERLASPLVLLALAGLFGLAFWMLLPGREAFRAGVSAGDGLDAVELAYLRARRAAGESLDPELDALARELLGAGRTGEARTLVDAFPDAALGDGTRFLLGLEEAAAALAAHTDGPPRRADPDPGLVDALASRLARLRDEPGLQDPGTLARGAALAFRLERPALRATLHARLAAVDPDRASTAWAECGRAASAAGARALAIDCYRRAIDTLGTGTGDGAGEVLVDAERLGRDAFDLRLALLGQLVGEEDEVARSATVDALLGQDLEDVPRLDALARTLLAVERPGDAARVYGRLAELDRDARVAHWLEAARWAEAAGRPALAAAWADLAAKASPAAERDALGRRVEALLVAAGREREVLERVAARIEASPGDRAALADGIRLARAAGELARAARWNERLLERAPEDADALGLAIDLALAEGNLESARAAAERAVFRLPANRGARVRLAQIAEWSGEPEVATAQWRILAADAPDGATLRELVRLARLTRQPGVAADAARRLALLSPPSEADVASLVELFELDGRPDAAAAALEAIVRRHGAGGTTLAALGRLHERHGNLRGALDAWERRARAVGADPDGTIARASLHWRLNERDAAGRVAARLRGADLAGVDGPAATLLSEIAWRERATWLARAVAPALGRIADPAQRGLQGRRLVEALRADGDLAGAVAAADRLWRDTGDVDFAISAMNLAVESGDATLAPAYLVADAVGPTLGSEPGYWTAAAALRLGQNDVEAARRDYERALELDPDDPATLASLLWLLIDTGGHEPLAALLDEHGARAADEPELWSAFAIGRFALGEPEASLAWFERLSDRIGADYGLLLGYADALEASGRVDAALRLRRHAFAKLRPALLETLEAGSTDRGTLLREYVALASRHDGLDERWTGVLLGDLDAGEGEGADAAGGGAGDGGGRAPGADERWREDVAIAWLLSTERHGHARLVMARLHGARADAPAWAALSVALAEDDLGEVSRILESGASLSSVDRLVALRAVGDERAAYALAADAMRADGPVEAREFAAGQYAELRGARPSWAEGFARRASLGTLDAVETGVGGRHTFSNAGFGLSFEVLRRSLASDALALEGRDELADASLALLAGDRRRGLELRLGIETGDGDPVLRGGLGARLASADGRRELGAELALAERPTESPALAVGALRDRLTLRAETAFGHREYARAELGASAHRTRGEPRSIADGTAAAVEVGTRGAVGGSEWSAGVRAAHERHDRRETLPDGLALSADASRDSVLAPRQTTLALGASLVHGGGVGAGFPRTAGPRWFVEGSVDHAWPDRSFGVRASTGLGLRVLGGDELSFTLSHDTRASSADVDGTALGIGYRFHF